MWGRGGWTRNHWIATTDKAAVASQHPSGNQLDKIVTILKGLDDDPVLVPSFANWVLHGNSVANSKVRQGTGAGVVPLLQLVVGFGSGVFGEVVRFLPFGGECSTVRWERVLNRVAVDELGGRLSRGWRRVSILEKGFCPFVNVHRRGGAMPTTLDKLFNGFDGCFGPSVGLGVIGRGSVVGNAPSG